MTRIGEATDAISDAITKVNADVTAVSALITNVSTKAPVVLKRIRTTAQALGFTVKMPLIFSPSTKAEEVKAVLVTEESPLNSTTTEVSTAKVKDEDLRHMVTLGRLVAKKDDREAFEEAATYLAISRSEGTAFVSLWQEFEEGARNNCDGQYHLEAIQRRLTKRAEKLYEELS